MRPDPLSGDALHTGPVISSLEIREASPAELASLSRLTTQNLRPLLARGATGEGLCNLVAWVGEVPAGLLVSRQDPDRPWTQEILSLMVTPLLRRQGLARNLLTALAARMKAAGRRELSTSWSDRLPQLESFIALLAREGWQAPEPARLRMSFNVGERKAALRALQPRIAAARRSGLASQPLSEAGPAILETLQAAATAYARSGLMPAWANPAPWLEGSDPAASRILLDGNGHLCGWLIGQYQPAFRRWTLPIGWAATGPGHMLLAIEDWLAALEAREGNGATLILQPSHRNGQRVCTLLDRHFRPHALWADHLVISRKALVD